MRAQAIIVVTLLLGCPGTEGEDGSLFSSDDGIQPTGPGEGSTGGMGETGTGSDEGSTSAPPPPPTTTSPPPDPDTGSDGPPPPPIECGPTPVGGTDPLVDDLELEEGQTEPDSLIPSVDGRQGFWFTYNDGTAGGTQEPPEPFVPSAGGANDSELAARTWGDGFTTWGAGMGISLNNDFGGDCPYDVSAFTGVGFWMQGAGTVRMHVSTQATVPPELGGTCNAAPGMCHDDHGVDLMASETWTYHELAWDEMTQQGWGQAAAFDPTQVLQLHWQVGPGVAFDVWVDEVVFLTE